MQFYLITLLLALATPLLAQDTCEGRAEGFYCTQDRSSFLWCFNQQSLPGATTVLRCPFGTYCECPAGEVCGESGPCSGSGNAPSSSESGPLTQGGLPLDTGMESSEETQGSESQGTVMESSEESQPSESEPSTQGEQPLLSGTESQGSGIETILNQPSGTELGSTEQPNPTEPSSTEGGETTTLPAPLEYPQNFYYLATIEDSLNGVPQSSTIQNVYHNSDEGQLRVDQNGIRQYTSQTTEGAIQRTFEENSRACDTSSLDIFPVYRFDPRYQFQQNTFYQGQPALLYTYNTQTLDSSEQGTLYVAQGLETIPLFEQVTVTRSSPDMMGVTQTSTTYNSFVAGYPPESTFILPPACLLGEESSE